MAKKVIQVPVDEDLLESLDRESKKQNKARAELIRQACERYLRQLENEELDKLYLEGYEKIPEESDLGKVQVAVAGQVLPGETW